jgi:hypothetical protein
MTRSLRSAGTAVLGKRLHSVERTLPDCEVRKKPPRARVGSYQLWLASLAGLPV